jgi:hypothetical protein
MFGLSGAAVGGIAAGAGMIGGALISSNASENAADAQSKSAAEANATQRYIFDTQNEQAKPYREAGYNALEGLNGLMKDPSGITSQPGYQFGLNQGQTAIDRSAASRGSLYSGATLKALQRYGQDYGSTKLNESYNRLSNIAGLGQVANGQSMQAGMNYGNNVSANQIGMGNAQAANALNQGNTWGNAVNQLGAYGDRNGWFSGGGGSANSFGGANSQGFGSGSGYGNQDLGEYF